MNKNPVYEETVPFGFVAWIVVLFALLAVFFIGLFMYQAFLGPIGDTPAPNGYFAFMFLVFAASALIISNMRALRIRIDERGFLAAYGMFRQEYGWDIIESAEVDAASVFRYGGWGIRYTRAEGYWRRGYTVIGAPRVVLTLRRGLFRQFAFSTNRPEEMVRIIGDHIQSTR